MQQAGINPDEPLRLSGKRLTLRSALGRVLKPLDLTAVPDHGFLLITPRPGMEETLRLGIYDVSDLVARGLSNDAIADAVMTSTEAPWMGFDAYGSLATPMRGCLVVRQHEAGHREIAALIEDWRAGSKPSRIEPADRR